MSVRASKGGTKAGAQEGTSRAPHKAAVRAVSSFVRRENGIQWVGKGTRWRLARAFREAVAKQLEGRVVSAIKKCWRERLSVKDVVLCGGVGSNIYLQHRCVVTAST